MADNQELRAKLADIDRRIADIQASAKPIRDEYDEKLRPFLVREMALDEERELLLDEYSTEVIGTCEGCSALILEGDRYFSYEDGPHLCLECSPTWTEAVENMRSYTHDLPDDQRELEESIAHAEAQIAAGRGDEKVC